MHLLDVRGILSLSLSPSLSRARALFRLAGSAGGAEEVFLIYNAFLSRADTVHIRRRRPCTPRPSSLPDVPATGGNFSPFLFFVFPRAFFAPRADKN